MHHRVVKVEGLSHLEDIGPWKYRFQSHQLGRHRIHIAQYGDPVRRAELMEVDEVGEQRLEGCKAFADEGLPLALPRRSLSRRRENEVSLKVDIWCLHHVFWDGA